MTCRQQHAQLIQTPNNRRSPRWYQLMAQVVTRSEVTCATCGESFFAEHFYDEQPKMTTCIDCRSK